MKKDNTTLLVIGCLSAALLLFRKQRATSGVGRLYGGNSGYIDYSMSKRAAGARANGRYPKTDFKKVYGLTDNVLAALVEMGYIDNREWHHTSKFGNRTVFYGWDDDIYNEIYQQHKKEIDKLIRNNQVDDAGDILSEYAKPYFEEIERKEALEREAQKIKFEENKKSAEREKIYRGYFNEAIETILSDREEAVKNFINVDVFGEIKKVFNGYWINLSDVQVQISPNGYEMNRRYSENANKKKAKADVAIYLSNLLAEADKMAREQMGDVM